MWLDTVELTLSFYFENIDISAGYYILNINTSNRAYDYIVDSSSRDEDEQYATYSITATADMDVNDTAYMTVYQNGGAAQTDVNTGTYFTGCLIG